MDYPIDIYLDDYHLHSTTEALPSYVQWPIDGLESPDIRMSSYLNAGQDGETTSNALYGSRIISLQGTVRGTDRADFLAKRQELVNAVGLRHDSLDRLTPRILRFAPGDGKTYRIPVTTNKFTAPHTYMSKTKFMLDLKAMSYAIEGDDLHTVSTGLPRTGGSSFPWSFPLSFGGGGGGSVTAHNDGNEAAKPIITIAGPVINPMVLNATTGEWIRLNLTLGSGDIVVIDTDALSIIQGGATSRMGAKTDGSDFWTLAPGDNVISFSANVYDTALATVEWRDTYLSA